MLKLTENKIIFCCFWAKCTSFDNRMFPRHLTDIIQKKHKIKVFCPPLPLTVKKSLFQSSAFFESAKPQPGWFKLKIILWYWFNCSAIPFALKMIRGGGKRSLLDAYWYYQSKDILYLPLCKSVDRRLAFLFFLSSDITAERLHITSCFAQTFLTATSLRTVAAILC